MTVIAGTTFGQYEIVAALGAGGMGEVYRAHDSKLGRDVALKILPDSFARDPERVARFKREAQVLASLNHPHIGAIYGLEESGSTQFLVLELVDGETIAQRLLLRGAKPDHQSPASSLAPSQAVPASSAQASRNSRGLPLEEALAIARQIVDALEAAHEKGIIHRDLKPANVALTANDQVKVLDFGLAKAVDASGSSNAAMNSPTLTAHATQAGVILGTAAYMSPEQAKGRIADKRSDIWAFGCVLFEMLTGKRAFEGEDVSDTLAGILRGDPDWTALPAELPAQVRTLITNCLKKDRTQRIGDIAVARYVLDAAPSAVSQPAPALAPAVAPRRSWVGFAAAAAAALVAAAGGWSLKPSATPPIRTLTRFPVALGADQAIIPATAGRHLLALSPDGTRLVYAANNALFLRPLDQLEAAPIRGAVDTPFEPVFSPDGQWVAYHSGTHLMKIAVTGGAPTTIGEAPPPWGMSWDRDRIVFGDGGGGAGIMEVPATGGVPRVLIAAGNKGAEFLHGPHVLPGGDAVLFTIGTAGAVIDRWSSARIAVQSITTGARKILVEGGTDAQYLPTGHLVYSRDGVLFANAFDVTRLELRGGPTAVVEGVARAAGGLTGAVHLAVSENGTMAYAPAGASVATMLAWRQRDGTDTPIAAPPHTYETPRMSPDGARIAIHAADQDNDIWIWDVKSETLTRLTFDKAPDSSPVWTRDSKRVIYQSAAEGLPNLYWKAADGTGAPERLLAKPPASNGALVPNGATPDGKELIYSVGVPAHLMALPLVGDRQPRTLLAPQAFAERGGDVSPDARWLAYNSDESGALQVYVRPYPDVNSGRWQISGDGGSLPKWSPNGRELFYVDARAKLVSVPVTAGATFAFGKTTAVFDMADSMSVLRNYDPTPDGSRFIVVKQPRTRGGPQFVVVENWFEELKARVPIK